MVSIQFCLGFLASFLASFSFLFHHAASYALKKNKIQRQFNLPAK